MESYYPEELTLIYTVKATDEFGRHYEVVAKIGAQYLMFKEQADQNYQQIMITLLTNILLRMGSDAKAEWTVEVDEELSINA